MKVVIGVDIGSSGIKAVLYEPEKEEVLYADERSISSRIRSSPEYFEEDPITLRDQVFHSIRSLVNYASSNDHIIEAIAFTGQMHGGLLVDRDLQPLTPIITWQDKRGNERRSDGKTYVEELRELLPYDPTGVSVHSGFLIPSLYWLRVNGLFPNNAAKVLGIYDWLQSILIGRAVTDVSSAAAWAMFDPISKSWKASLIDFAGIDKDLLPDVAEPGSKIGNINSEIARALGIEDRVAVYASVGDTQAAYLGSGTTSKEVLVNFGTGSQSMWETKFLEATHGTDIRYLRDGRYLACAPTLAGGEAYNIMADFFRDVLRVFTNSYLPSLDIFRIMDELALSSNSEGIAIDPIFQGSKFRDDADRASVANLTKLNFKAGPFIRALVEGMVEEIAAPYYLRGEYEHTGLVGGGNALRPNSALRQVAEERFNLPLRVSKNESEAAVGAAMLCL